MRTGEIAFGVECLWWDYASRATVTPLGTGSVLHCPFCGGRCDFHATRESYLAMARRFEIIGFPFHQALIRWCVVILIFVIRW